MKHPFTAAELARLNSMFDSLTTWQSAISLPQLLALIVVAKNPGLSVNELAEKLDQPQQTVSRYVSILLGRYQVTSLAEQPAFIRQEINASDPRSRALFLTSEGHELLKSLSGSK